MPRKPSRSASHADESMVEKIPYRGWNSVWRLSNGTVELIVLADVGPRIVQYGFCGQEGIFYEATSDRGLTGGDGFRLYGGHRLWVWPEVARTYFPDNRPVTVSQEEDCCPLPKPDRRSCAGNAPGERIRGCAGCRRHAGAHRSYHHESERGCDRACHLVSHDDAPWGARHSAASSARRDGCGPFSVGGPDDAVELHRPQRPRAGSLARSSFSYRRRAIFRDDSQSN